MRSTSQRLKTFPIAMVLLLLFGIMAPANAGSNGLPSYADLADQVKDPVVNIFTTKVTRMQLMNPFGSTNPSLEDFFRHFFGDLPETKRKTTALGSGVVIGADGLILTNHHVIEKAETIKVRLENQNEYDATVVGRDPKTDLALIRADFGAEGPQPAELGDSDRLRVGDGVMAVGNPFGLGHTVTVGIISAKGRIIGAGPYDDFLQTDAAINPGNSGGPLFNVEGEVVGINTAIVAGGQGVGFAIPISLVKELLPQLKTGQVKRGWLGVSIQDLSPELAASFSVDAEQGVLIADVVPDSPADRAGLKRGDVVQELDNRPVNNAHQLSRMVAALEPDTQVQIRILRNGNKKTLQATLGTLPGTGEAAAAAPSGRLEKQWGLDIQQLTSDLAEQLGLPRNEKGVVITRVAPMSPAGDSDLKVGDVIKEVNRTPVDNPDEFRRQLRRKASKDSLLLLVKRGGATFYVVLQKTPDAG